MSEIVWTKEKPTKRGWYWWRRYKYKVEIILWIFELRGKLHVRDTRFLTDAEPLDEWAMAINGGEWSFIGAEG